MLTFPVCMVCFSSDYLQHFMLFLGNSIKNLMSFIRALDCIIMYSLGLVRIIICANATTVGNNKAT